MYVYSIMYIYIYMQVDHGGGDHIHTYIYIYSLYRFPVNLKQRLEGFPAFESNFRDQLARFESTSGCTGLKMN